MKFQQKILQLIARYEHEPYNQYYLARVKLQQYLVDKEYMLSREW